jgi:signal transduction histidine kinase
MTVTTADHPVAAVAAEHEAQPHRGRGLAVLLVVAIAALIAVDVWKWAGGGDEVFDPVTQGIRVGLLAAWGLAGVVLTSRRPSERLGFLVLAGTALGAAAAATDAAILDGNDSVLVELVCGLSVGVLPAVALHVLLALPTGDLVKRTHRNTVITGYVVGALVGLAMGAGEPPLPLWVIGLEATMVVLVGAGLSNARYRAARGQERQRMQWFGWAVTVAAEVTLVTIALRLFLGWPDYPGEVAAAATVILPLSFVFSTSKRMLPQVDKLLAHTVSLTGLTGVVVAVYLVIVLGLGRVPNDDERTILLLSMCAAGIAALLYLPTRARLNSFSNRLVYGEQYAPDEALRTFGSRLSRAIPLDELLLQLAESLRKTLVLERAEVWTGSSGVLERTVSVPDQGPGQLVVSETEQPVVARAGVVGPAWLAIWLSQLLEGRQNKLLRVAPIAHSGELLGLVVVQRPGDAEPFADDDESVLAELARQVGLALHNVQLDSALQESLEEVKRQAEELRVSRARVVAAADAERRKIERDLHDGAQQHLVALAVSVRLARQLADSDPETTKEMLDQLGVDLQEAVQELRNLAHGIYPPLLMDRGLEAALGAAAGRAALPTGVEAEGIGRYPQQVEAAIYFCCLEALQNAGKHAGEGADATITLREEEGKLFFEVADTGAGFDMGSAAAKGHGFINMSDRIGAIGGAVGFESAPGKGTRISGSVPIGSGLPAD